MNYAITYGDSLFKNQRQIGLSSLSRFVEKAILYTEKDLAPYYSQYPDILYPGARGGGFWLYKAIFLSQMMENIQEGDGLMWTDAACELIGDPAILFEIAQNHKGFCLFKQNHKNCRFIHKDCFQHMGCDNKSYLEDYQSDACIMVYTKTKESVNFLKEFLFYCTDADIITDSKNRDDESPDFYDHRHDQAIHSLLCSRDRIPRFRTPTQYGVGEDMSIFSFYERAVSALYPTLINNSRNRF